jgi:acyl-CoA synthetase (AMP-forming)/AMP-acid ligase II
MTFVPERGHPAKVMSAFTFIFTCLHHILRFIQVVNRRLFNVRRSDNLKENSTAELPSYINGGPLRTGNSVFSYLEQGLQRNRHGLAVICLHQPASHLSSILSIQQNLGQGNKDLNDCLTINYDQLHQAAQRLAAGLASAGAKAESNMMMLIPNGGEYAILMWCCIIMRITYVCVDPDVHTVSGYKHLKDIMRSVKPSIVVTAGHAQAVAIDISVDDLRLSPPIRISIAEDVTPGWRRLATFTADVILKHPEKLLELARNDSPNRINSIIFTSGTSGTPKGCPLRVSSMCHILESQSWLVTEQNSRRALQSIHNSRGIAPFQTLQTWKAGGATMMIKDSGNIEQMTAALRNHAPSFIAVSSAMVTAIQDETSHDAFVAESVKTVQIGGEVVTTKSVEECKALFPEARVCVNHGMTEGAGSFTWPFFDTMTDCLPIYGDLCSIGKVAPGSVVRVWSPSTQRAVKRNHIGQLHICGGNLLRQYLGGKSSTSFMVDKDGSWFVTGDMAMIDREGVVFILGRSKEMIVTKRGIIVPAAVETTIRDLTGAQVSPLSKDPRMIQKCLTI